MAAHLSEYLASIFGLPEGLYGLKLTDRLGYTAGQILRYELGRVTRADDNVDFLNVTGIPSRKGDGLSVALDSSPHISTRGYYAAQAMIVRYEEEDVLGETAGILRLRKCVSVRKVDTTTLGLAVRHILAPLNLVEAFPQSNWEGLFWWPDEHKTSIILGDTHFLKCGVFRWNGDRFYGGNAIFEECVFRHLRIENVALINSQFKRCVFVGSRLHFLPGGDNSKAFQDCTFINSELVKE